VARFIHLSSIYFSLIVRPVSRIFDSQYTNPTLLVANTHSLVCLHSFIIHHDGCKVTAHAVRYITLPVSFLSNTLSNTLVFSLKPHSSSLSQHVNHQITAQKIFLCTIRVPYFLYISSCSSCFCRGSCTFYIFTTTHSQTVQHIVLYISESHSLKILCQTFVLLCWVPQSV
jgi:hypothetical protein